MIQPALIVESLLDAVLEVARVCGGIKTLAVMLWPEKPPEAAARLLRDCLNDNRSERLSPDQLLLIARIGRERGCHAVMHYLASEAGYAQPQPVEPEDEKAALMREFIESQRRLQALASKMERAGLMRAA